MYCLHCGDCCLRMSPISSPAPCPNIIRVKDFFFCKVYENRPKECVSHQFDNRFCPVGLSKLGLNDPDSVRLRIDIGFLIIKNDFVYDSEHIKQNIC